MTVHVELVRTGSGRTVDRADIDTETDPDSLTGVLRRMSKAKREDPRTMTLRYRPEGGREREHRAP